MANYNTSFIINAADLAKILDQIKIAERNAAGESLVDIIGQDAALLPMGLRTVDGSLNHLLPGQSLAGAADQVFPRLLTPHYINEQDGDTQMLAPPGTPGLPPGGLFVTNTNYDPRIAPGSSPFGVNNHSVADADPRIISNLIVDQTLNNRSALVAALLVLGGGANGGDISVATTQADAILAARATAAAATPGAILALQATLSTATTANTAAQGVVTTAQGVVTTAQGGVTTAQTNVATEQAQGAAANATLSADSLLMTAATQAYIDAVGTADPLDDAPALAVLNTAIVELNAAQATVTQEGLDLAAAQGALTTAQGGLATAQTGLTTAQAAAAITQLAVNAAQAALTAATGSGTALTTLIADAGLEISSDGSILIEQRSADIGLSPANSAWMAFFGQFFDHGLDLVTKGTNGTIYIPLEADDPLIAGADHILVDDPLTAVNEAADNLAPQFRFMVLTRTTPFDANGNPSPIGTESQNTTTPFVDQNQTYTSSASHQVFLREYKFSVDAIADINNTKDSFALNTGHLLNGVNGGIANWAEVKAQSAEKLGLQLSDIDVLNVPKLMVDAYGNFIAGAHGFAQVYVQIQAVNANGSVAGTVPGEFIMEGVAGGLNLHTLPVPAGLPALPAGQTYVVSTIGTGHAFLNDIAHNAVPGTTFDTDGNPATPGVSVVQADADNLIGNPIALDFQGHKVAYDDELLNQHFITGDGRGNENIGLTAVHTIFHSEHNRLVEVNKDTLVATGDVNVVNQWLAAGPGGVRSAISQAQLDAINNAPTSTPAEIDAKAAAIDNLDWDGGRLFQAARFVTEMQYQHLVFEEFARRVQPLVDPFVFTNSAELNPAIVAEFAHTVYRFGHSMLPDTVDRLDNDLTLVNSNNAATDDAAQVRLIEAFLNPLEFSHSAGTLSGVSDETAVGALIRGMSRQTGNEIDEFVVEAVRSNLLGLPLDLPALNIARGRAEGVPTLNDARAEIYAMTGAADVKPYISWTDFAQNLKHPLSVINFIAAYGTHAALTAIDVDTLQERKDVAFALVMGGSAVINKGGVGGVEHTFTAIDADRHDFLNATGAYAGGTLGGLNAIDLWVGGLAEKLNEFGGQLGSTFNYVFEYQMEHLQNGDRLYYLSRTQGMNLLNLLEPNSFTDLVMRNTDLGDIHSTHLPGDLMSVSDFIFELDREVRQEDYSGADKTAPLYNPDPLNRSDLDPTKADAFEQGINPMVFRHEGTARVGPGALDAEGKQIYDGGILKFSGGEHVVLGGTEGNDTLLGDRGIDTLWGDGGNDYINAGMESDQVYGGDGDDIIDDPFGDNFLRGDGGDDVITSDSGLTLMFGGEGQDFIQGITDPKEVFAGPGNDFILGGSAADALLGNEGDDWIEGGEGFDGISGENSELFFNSPIIGHDILWGQGNDTDYDGETGDDIMVQGSGIQRNNGMLGFDWSIQKGDESGGGIIDLGISRFLTQAALTLRDRNDSVEGASGWKFNDTLIGTSSPVGAVGAATGPVGGPVTDSNLLSQNVKLIHGMDTFLALTPGALRGQTVDPTNTNFASLAKDTTVFDPHNGGDILLGGAGSDLIVGKAGNDLIDGDRWLNVKISVHETKDATGPTGAVLFSVDSLTSIVTGVASHPEFEGKQLADLMRTGKINPGQLEAVRELITDGATAADTDVALYFGSRADFTFTRNLNGTVTVTDTVVAPILGADGIKIPLLNDEGTDTLSNIEIARFMNRDANGIPDGTFTDVSLAKASGAPTITSNGGAQLTASTAGIIDANGITAASVRYHWETSTDGTGVGTGAWTSASGTSVNPNFTPADTNFYRVVVTYTDGDGFAESVTSQITARVGTNGVENPFDGTADPNLLVGRGGNDTINGLGGNDIINGGTGADTLSGGAGNDTLIAGSDNVRDVLDGGADVDTADYSADAGNLTITLNGATPTVVTGSGTTAANSDTIANFENATGGSGNDTITGDGSDNILRGGGGNDSLNGGLGNDTLDGGTNAANTGDIMTGGGGNDTYVIDDVTGTVAQRDQVNEAAGAAGGIDTVTGSVNLTLANYANVENITLTGTGNFSATGSAGDNVLTGNSGNNALIGLLGTDTAVFTGSALDHSITTTAAGVLTIANAADGTDTLTGIEKVQFGTTLYTTLLADVNGTTITGTAGNDLIFGLGGNDTINAGTGDDAIVWRVGDGRDVVSGGGNGTVGDAFSIIGDATAETYTIYARADWLLVAGNLVTDLNANTDIVVTRNGSNTGSVVAELDQIEEIVINTAAGADSVLVVGNFTPTDLRFNTITVNDGGGKTTVDLTGLTSGHHIAFHTSGGDDKIIGAREQDEVIDNNKSDPPPPSGVNAAPVVSGPVTLSASDENKQRHITSAQLLANASDPNGDVMSVIDLALAPGSLGSLVAEGNGSWLFTPGANDSTSVTFEYKVSDGVDASAVATANLDLLPKTSGGGDHSHDGDENVEGTSGKDHINSGKGSDHVSGNGGDDEFVASQGDGNDTYHGGSGHDTYNLSGTSGGAMVNLTSGKSHSGDTGSDTLISIEHVVGGSGNDHITGDGVANMLYGGGGNDDIHGKGGSDKISGGAGADTLSGDAGNDKISGDDGMDKLYGGAGNDSLNGGKGADLISGGSGNDAMHGGAGSDTFVFAPGFGHDTISDFDADPNGGQDHIDLHAFGITQATFAEHVFIMSTSEGTKVMIDNSENTILLQHITNPANVTIDDFRF